MAFASNQEAHGSAYFMPLLWRSDRKWRSVRAACWQRLLHCVRRADSKGERMMQRAETLEALDRAINRLEHIADMNPPGWGQKGPHTDAATLTALREQIAKGPVAWLCTDDMDHIIRIGDQSIGTFVTKKEDGWRFPVYALTGDAE